MAEAFIVAAARTAVGKFGGTLAKTAAPDLGATVIRALLERSGLSGEQVGEVILGQVLAAGSGQNPARQAVIKSGLPNAVPAMTINKVCGSGLKAVMLAAQAIRDGDSEIIIAGGQENMSAAPHVLPNSRDGQRMGNWSLVDTMITDGLWDVYNQYHMGITAENVAKQYGISREDQDAFAAESQRRAVGAVAGGAFIDEIVPVYRRRRTALQHAGLGALVGRPGGVEVRRGIGCSSSGHSLRQARLKAKLLVVALLVRAIPAGKRHRQPRHAGSRCGEDAGALCHGSARKADAGSDCGGALPPRDRRSAGHRRGAECRVPCADARGHSFAEEGAIRPGNACGASRAGCRSEQSSGTDRRRDLAQV